MHQVIMLNNFSLSRENSFLKTQSFSKYRHRLKYKSFTLKTVRIVVIGITYTTVLQSLIYLTVFSYLTYNFLIQNWL